MVRNSSLDGLRGLAVLLVLFSHASIEGLYLLPWLDFRGMGQCGVYLFFILSAYLLDTQILEKCLSSENTSLYWKNYVLRRVLRIYPLYFLVLILYYLISKLNLGESSITNVTEILQHLLLLKGDGIFWTIAVEFKYYLISPILILFSLKICKSKWSFVGFYLFVIFLSFLITKFFHLEKIDTIKYLPIFLIGTLLSFYYVGLLGKIVVPKYLLIISVLCLFLTIPSLYYFVFGVDHALFGWPGFSVYALFWGVVLYTLITDNKSFLFKFFSWGPLRFVGKISFSVYLLHIPILKGTTKLVPVPGQFQLLFFIALTIVISYLSFSIVEKPLSKIRFSR